MPDLYLTQQPVGEVASMRVASSEAPDHFRACMARTLTALDQGDDVATAAWTAADPVRLAAEIEAMAGVRRLNIFRKDSK
ncbi:hypothetical protein FSY75_09605 [Streptomyces sp. TR1341]|uniref:hypothetical protein n=1 Tax=Streptomyces sp. TR1341 TaxID=2601266 RepID=UPI00138B0138|nr:hypothetical protein [Streptomyces sp. TR1341]